MNRKRYIISAVLLLVAGIWHAEAARGAEPERKTAKTAAEQLLRGSRRDSSGRISVRCQAVRMDTSVVLQARILRDDYAVRVSRGGLRLELENGETLTLDPERQPGCCGDWAQGRWNSVSFRLSEEEREKLEGQDLVSVTLLAEVGPEERIGIERKVPSGKRKAIGRMLRRLR